MSFTTCWAAVIFTWLSSSWQWWATVRCAWTGARRAPCLTSRFWGARGPAWRADWFWLHLWAHWTSARCPYQSLFFLFFFFSMIYPVCFPSYHKHPLPERLAHIWFTVDSDHSVEGDDALPSAEACREQAHSCRGDGFALNWMCGKRFYGLTSLPRTQHSIDTCI